MRRRATTEEKIKNLILRRRRAADSNARRRAEKWGAKVVCDISRDEIRERDQSTCYLCSQFVSVHDMTLDHVVPLSEGGEHTPENVRLAHRVCNSKKGDRLLAEINLSEW